jgi:hypothetical protein
MLAESRTGRGKPKCGFVEAVGDLSAQFYAELIQVKVRIFLIAGFRRGQQQSIRRCGGWSTRKLTP